MKFRKGYIGLIGVALVVYVLVSAGDRQAKRSNYWTEQQGKQQELNIKILPSLPPNQK